jgi:hypothetical protein
VIRAASFTALTCDGTPVQKKSGHEKEKDEGIEIQQKSGVGATASIGFAREIHERHWTYMTPI